MLEQYLQQLASDLELDPVEPKDAGLFFYLELTPEMKITLKELDPGFYVLGRIAPCPAQKKEELFIQLMKANFLGLGTGESVIGLDSDEKFLTLARTIPYDSNYTSFKETIEDFANYLDYWRREVERHQKAADEGIL